MQAIGIFYGYKNGTTHVLSLDHGMLELLKRHV